MEFLPRSERRRIGLIAGSGPEAGADLWIKVIEETKDLLGERYAGDLDGPRVRIISSPILGLSMELETNDVAVWPELERVFSDIAGQTDFVAIACNTLNYYERQIKAEPRIAELVSVGDVVERYLTEHGHDSVALLGSAPVTKMDNWSAYQRLARKFNVEVPDDTAELHQIIYDVKRFGGNDASVVKRFGEMIDKLESETVLLACTELPLINYKNAQKDLIDVTRLLARRLVEKSFCKDA
ncbi:Aspartate racemase [Roseovarius albus]|uniref:Aspartate racemase n=1 Tax=Roseovarius albus TaxID=1247867 RepID=A0A1X6YWZ1_9RHOB|nr:aspartate/glutamate racemase family protein [Roseovarius albus]SLN34198.1 Aspartate racemase [Roseovarius albus]